MKINKKFSYRRQRERPREKGGQGERASIIRCKRHFDMLNRLGVDYECDRQTDKRADRQTKAIILYYSAVKPISIIYRERRLAFRRAKRPTRLLCDSEQMVGY